MTARPRILLFSALVSLTAVLPAGEAAVAEEPTEDLVPILTLLDVPFQPEGTLTPEEVDAQRAAIRASARGLRGDLSETEYEDFDRYPTFPYVSVEVNRKELEEVAESSQVAAIHEDVALRPALAESTALIEAPAAWAMGATGSGQTVAILDTGVDAGHPFLAGKVVEEACYSSGKDCPNGKGMQIGAGAARPCTYSPECGHGTHVAGIAAGSGPSFSGVAPGANIMAVQVFSEATGASCGFPGTCALAMTSDLLKALERVYYLRSKHSFAAVNLSLGWGSFAGQCDTDPMKPVIDNLRAVGIATVVASGNAGATSARSAPSCISSAVSVGATSDVDPEEVAAYSNSSQGLSLLAPGSGITSSVPGGGYETWEGTSMAAPHVAGALAVLKGADPAVPVSTMLANLQATAKPITDPRNGLTVGRIRVWGALTGQAWVPPSPGQGGHKRHITLRLTGHLEAHGKVTVSDDAASCLSDRVSIDRKAAGNWRKVRATMARNTGKYKVQLPDRPGIYRAALSATAACLAAVSARRKNR